MSHAALSFPRLPGVSSVSLVGSFGSLAVWAVLAGAVVLAGCASKPQTVDGRASTTPPVRPYDRDRAPSDAPPDLAALPDPVPQVEPIKPGGPNKPYTVLGQSYEPIPKDVSWREEGLASWYGTKFHGRKTASGEMFNMYALTAAHRTLPIPSYARVRHAKSGKEIIVRINDRGPFHGSRVIDLSYAAAVKLGFVGAGAAQVVVERLTFDEIRSGAWRREGEPGSDTDPELGAEAVAMGVPEPLSAPDAESLPAKSVSDDAVASPSPSASGSAEASFKVATARAYTAAAKGFWVQLAALAKRDGVERLHQKAVAALADQSPMLAIFREASYFKLQLGPYGSRSEAVAAAEQAKEALQLTPMVVERR